MNSTYKLSDMNFVRMITRAALLALALVAIFAFASTPIHANMASSTDDVTMATNTPPIIVLNGDATTTVFTNNAYVDLGAYATDAEDGDIDSSLIITTGSVDTTVTGTSTLTYTVTDTGGLSDSVLRDVVVVGSNSTTTSTTSVEVVEFTSSSTSEAVSETGSITFCHMVWNGNAGVFATSSNGLPTGTFTFSAAFAGPNSTSTGRDPLTISPISFSTGGITVDTAIFGSSKNGECVTVNGLEFGYYTYSEAAISNTVSTSSDMQWKGTLYNDQYDVAVQSLGDFFTFSSTTNENSDGVISIGENRPHRTLVILESFGSAAPTITPPTGGNGGSSGNSGGTGGGSNGGSSNNGGSSRNRSSSSDRGSNSDSSSNNGGTENIDLSSCSFLKDYLHIGWNNNPIEVKKLQIFLNVFDNSSLSVTGVFDTATFAAVETFQKEFASDILTPWGYAPNEPTGYVYLLTKKKINEIVCGKMIALSSEEQREVTEFNQFLTALKAEGIAGPSTGASQGHTGSTPRVPTTGGTTGSTPAPTTGSTGTTGGTGAVGTGSTNGFGSTTGATSTDSTSTTTAGLSKGTMANLAAAIFSMPQSGTELTRCIFNLIIILAIIYIITSILVNNDEEGAAALARSRTRKLWFYLAGVIIATAFALFFDMFCLVAPLLLTLIILVIILVMRHMNSDNPSDNHPTGSGPGQHPLIVENHEHKVETPVVETPVTTIPTPTPLSTPTAASASAEPSAV